MTTSDQEPILLPELARLHESTIKRAEEHIESHKRRRTRRKSERVDMSHVKVHPEVWETALGLAGGNARRITVVSATEVIVRN